MRKRDILLATGILAVVAMPAAALATVTRSAQPFSAGGYLCLVQLPNAMQAWPDGNGNLYLKASGEVLAGQIESSDGWDALQDASVKVTITREDSLFSFSETGPGGTFSGAIRGNIALDSAEGPIAGTFDGSITGAFSNSTDIVGSIYTSTPVVQWSANGRSGAAEGTGSATFVLDPANPYAYCGTLTLSGSVRGR